MQDLRVGADVIRGIYLGATAVAAVYYGGLLLWTAPVRLGALTFSRPGPATYMEEV